VIALVLGLVLLLPALGLLAGGAALLRADRAHRTADGYLQSSQNSFSTGGYALISERIDLSTGADWLPLSTALGTARLEVTGADPTTDVFVGIAPVDRAQTYLEGVQRTVVGDLGVDASNGGRVDLPGGAPSGPPTGQDFWAAQSSGSGTRQLSWSPSEGNWMLVVMNADGSAGVAVDGRVGATVPALGGVAWGLLVSGLVLAVLGALLVALAIRRSPSVPTGMPPGGAFVPAPGAAGPPQGWNPPTAGDRDPGSEGTAGPGVPRDRGRLRREP
jgi:hypothetical protein